jgi:predicted acetyltransferase
VSVTKPEIRPLTADDDLTAQRDLGERAFGAMSAAARNGWLRRNALTAAAGRYFAVFDGSRQVGGAAFFDMRQWWAGREVPMAGVASVKMAPEARGQGMGRQLMAELLREIAERGYPLSALYPATMPIYRSLGWELAGGRYHAVIPTRSLRSVMPPDAAVSQGEPAIPALRAVAAGDAAEVITVLGRAHRATGDCGPVTRDLSWVEDWLTHGEEYRYIGGDAFVSYQWRPDNEGLFAGWAVAGSADSQRALWSLLAAHSSTADTVEVRTSPDSPIWLLQRERDAKLIKLSKWMLRVVDVKAAIEGRGFPAGVRLGIRLTIIDDCLQRNAGTWDLVVENGQGSLERVAGATDRAVAGARTDGAGTLTVGARGLAALYGGTPVSTLRLAGLAAGGAPAADAALSAAFAGQAYMLDDF